MRIEPRNLTWTLMPDVSGCNSRKVAARFQYIANKHHNCSLKIHQVEHNDAGIYTVRFNKQMAEGLNGELIAEGPVLYLSNMSSTNSGNYSCSLKTHSGTTSAVIHIDVEYGPTNTSVSVRPSMEVDAGSNITLICSSHANPPVENYTWFKIDDDDDIVAVGHQPVFFSGDGGHRQKSQQKKNNSTRDRL
ncbi:basigin-like [Enoplosus armatus]|uniref:basigin-like n=1 Tax=Enoplosus armatus TaxID=215367 RepID=UPI003996379F